MFSSLSVRQGAMDSQADLEKYVAASIKHSDSEVGIDFEGLDFDRKKKPISVAAIHFPMKDDLPACTFVVDMRNPDEVCHVKELCESKEVLKIIHNCATDSDILWLSHGITLRHVFDTATTHDLLMSGGRRRTGLNATLEYYYMTPDSSRPSNTRQFYEDNPNFWETRPLTQQMRNMASGDVRRLVELKAAVLDKWTRQKREDDGVALSRALAASTRNLCKYRDDLTTTLRLTVPRYKRGRMIGRGAVRLRAIEASFDERVSLNNASYGFVLYATSLEVAERAARELQQVE